MFYRRKLPKLEQLAPVYAAIVVFTYTWSVIQFFWRVPSWLAFSSIADVLAIFTYLITVNLIESLIILFLISFILFVLPVSWGYDQFVVKGFLLVITLLGFLAYRNYYVYPAKVLSELTSTQWVAWLGILAVILFAPFKSFPAFCRLVETFADRFIVFLYITIPISLISLIVVLYRNLF